MNDLGLVNAPMVEKSIEEGAVLRHGLRRARRRPGVRRPAHLRREPRTTWRPSPTTRCSARSRPSSAGNAYAEVDKHVGLAVTNPSPLSIPFTDRELPARRSPRRSTAAEVTLMTVLETASDRLATAGRTRTSTAAAILVAAVLVVSVLSVLVGSTTISPSAVLDTADPDHAIADRPARPHLPGAWPSAPRSGSPAPACRGSPATRWPTPASSASTPARRSRWCWRSRCFGVSDAVGVPLVRVRRRRGDHGRRARDRVAGPRRRHPGEAGDRRCRAHRGAVAAGRPACCSSTAQTMETFRFWQVGTVGGRGFDVLLTGLPFLVVGAVLALGGARLLNALALGDDLARGLGRRVARDRLVLGLAVRAARRRRHRAGRPDRLRRADRARTACAPWSGRDYARVLPFSLGYGAVLVVARRHRRPGRAAADRGPGRDHDRRRRRPGRSSA